MDHYPASNTVRTSRSRLEQEMESLNLSSSFKYPLSLALSGTAPSSAGPRWVEALLALPPVERDTRLEFVAWCARTVYDDKFFSTWLPRIMFMSWEDTGLLIEATKVLRKAYKGFAYFVSDSHANSLNSYRKYRATALSDVLDILSTNPCPNYAKSARLESRWRGKLYPADTDWDVLAEAHRHIGPLSLIETLFGAKDLR